MVNTITPVFVSIEAANVGALNTAVATAVTTAQALTSYLPNSVEVSNSVIVDSSNQKVYTTLTYKTQA
jgi:hypothetical protein